MNKQRQEIYAFRNDILHSEDLEAIALDLIENVCYDTADQYLQSKADEATWNPQGYRDWLMRQFPVTFDASQFEDDLLDNQELAKRASEKVIAAFKDRVAKQNAKIKDSAPPHVRMPENPSNEALRHLMIRKIDHYWQEHLLTMDHLRADVNLRAVGQRDPLQEFKHEAFRLFDLFGNKIRSEITHDLFRFELIGPDEPSLEELLSRLQMERNRSFMSDMGEKLPQLPQESASMNHAPAPAPEQKQAPEKLQPVVVIPKIGRNDPCPCGSGKKYKKCCGNMKDEEETEQQ
jgi:preprotein translocase subunit SecA